MSQVTARGDDGRVTLTPTRFIGFDTEFDPETRELVCVSYAERDPRPGARQGLRSWVRGACEPECRAELLAFLRDPAVCLVGMAFALDAVVLSRWGGNEVREAIIGALLRGGVSDVFVREWLYWVAFPEFMPLWQCATPWVYVSPGSEERHGKGDEKRPSFALSSIVERWTGRKIEASKQGDDAVRLHFGRVKGLPVSQWAARVGEETAQRFIAYAADDALDHLRAWEQQRAGKSRNVAFHNTNEGKILSGLTNIWGIVRGAVEVQPWLLPGEWKAVRDMWPMAWLCEPANGGLYVDPEYCDTLIERYRSVALAVECLGGDVLHNKPKRKKGYVEDRNQLSMFDEMLTAVNRVNAAKVVKVNKKHLRRDAHALYDMMPPGWAPPPTTTGAQKIAHFPRAWADWTDMHRRWASLSSKVLSEVLLTLYATDAAPEMIRALSWCVPTMNPGHALHHVSAAKWTAADVVEAGKVLTGGVRRVWAFLVRDTCLRTITNSLYPLAAVAVEQHHRNTSHAVTPTRANLLITGRYSLEGAIRQNANKAGAVREALVPGLPDIPRDDCIVYLADYSQIELFGFAKQIEFAYAQAHNIADYTSSLSQVLKAGKDAHIVLTLDLLAHSEPYLADLLRTLARDASVMAEVAKMFPATTPAWLLHDTAAVLRKMAKKWPKGQAQDERYHVGVRIDELRERAKRLNYGLGGMMQPAKFVETQRKYGDYSWTLQSATDAWSIWRARWHETAAFERWCREIVARGGYYVHPVCWRVRGALTLTQAANTTFQTPIAEMFKSAMWQAWLDTFDESSPMFGSRVVLPVHDEIVCVGPKAKAPEALARLCTIMKEAGAEYLPGLPIETSGGILPRFAKAA